MPTFGLVCSRRAPDSGVDSRANPDDTGPVTPSALPYPRDEEDAGEVRLG